MAQITLNSTGVASSGTLALQSNGTTTAVTIDASQNVGVGTSSPQRTLHVENSSGNLVRLNNSSSANGSYSSIELTSTGGNNCQIRGVQDSSTAGHLEFYTLSASAVSERMRIDSSGNVGIGTSSPNASYKMSITGNSASIYPGILFTDTNAGGGVFSIYGESAALKFRDSSAGVTRMTIDSSGNLLVGTTSSTGRIGSKAATTDNTGYGIYVEDSASAVMFYARNDGVISTGAKSASPYNNTTASAANMFVSSAGILQRSTSSLKYKTNVQDATHGLTELLTLRSVTYEGKTDGDKVFGGLIAEEVHEAGLTEFVQYAEDGSPDALNYGNMVSLCIKAIQQQQALIQTLTDRITALEQA